ncbi:MAG: transposase [Nitrospirae bacterium]|nr:transposase [Nitrospirota bacterium]
MFLFMNRFCVVCMRRLQAFITFLFPSRYRLRFGWRKAKTDKKIFYRRKPKPKWVRKEIIHLKALMLDAGCRKVANTFNRRFTESKKMTVSKTYTNNVIRKHKYEIQVLRKKIKNRIPNPVPMNLIWGVDLTGKTDTNGNLINILGIFEHKSRANLCLAAIKDKASITILRILFDAIELYGKPKSLRTDNESVFTSWIFRLSLWLNDALAQFRFWYNHVRPHQHLNGRTPAEVWDGTDIFTKGYKQEYWFEAWDGLLTGFYLTSRE